MGAGAKGAKQANAEEGSFSPYPHPLDPPMQLFKTNIMDTFQVKKVTDRECEIE